MYPQKVSLLQNADSSGIILETMALSLALTRVIFILALALTRVIFIQEALSSIHLDYLKKAEAANILPRGLKVEPRMMLVAADRATADEWVEQTRLNTLATCRWRCATMRR